MRNFDLQENAHALMTASLLADWTAFFCVAINLLELSEIKEAIKQIQSNDELPSLSLKAQCLYAVEEFQKIADRRNVKIKLIKKQK